MREQPSFANAISEIIFILFPFIALLVIKLMKSDAAGIIYISDYSLATSIMYGQLLAKTFSVPDKAKNQTSLGYFKL